MPFQMPTTIASVLRGVQTQDYVLPAIQREFVWSRLQVARLFDSLMRTYPIGSFLFWKVDAAHSGEFKFYGFLKDYHEWNNYHCPVLDIPQGRPVTAILDGQQRLTALNISLRGSHAERIAGRHRGHLVNYPKTHLYLNVCAGAPENESGMVHDFRFFATPPESAPDAGIHWFPVHRIMDPDLVDGGGDLFTYIQDHGLVTSKTAFKVIDRLRRLVHEDLLVNYYEETDQNIDKVLDIFIRVNSGGTVLSYSDLLLSIATAQWTELDAREEIHDLVDELNNMGQNFSFTKDVVLKAGLVLTEVPDVGFKVTNFNHANMAKLESEWTKIESALRLAVGLLADFGFSAPTLPADSVLIPLSYYVYKRGLDEDYRNPVKHVDGRAAVRDWVVRTLVKPGVWGSGLDTLLRDLRRVISEHGNQGWPTTQIETAMAARGKPLTFSKEEIEELVETTYVSKQVFPLLALLFPGVDTRKIHHIDHVFPRALFKRRVLTKAGVPNAEQDYYIGLMNGLPNLQLLEGSININKRATLPSTWAKSHYGPNLDHYLLDQELVGLPEDIVSFPTFYEHRKKRLASVLAERLGVDDTMPSEVPVSSE